MWSKYNFLSLVLIILHELEISGVAVQETHQTTCSENFYCGDDLEAVLSIFHSYDYGHTLLRQLRKSLQMKKIIANAPSALYFAQPQHIINNNKKGYLLGHPRCSKKLQKSFEILDRKRNNNWPMMSFIHSFIHSEIRIQRISSDDNKLDGIDSYNQPQKL